ncbi:MAG TPA: DUF1345 domain-containing protein [Caulobacteraceae bacterium]|nr:DUF1345 domain-containing protein [Caulobacteraceae bacterium]
MSDSPPAAMRVTGRPRLIGSLALGLIVWIGLYLTPNDLRWSTRAIIGWDVAMLTFLALIFHMMAGCNIAKLQALAAKQDEAKGLILGLSICAAAAAVMAIGLEISLAKDEHGLEKTMRVALAFLTLMMSWLFVHVIFALHYAHEYYAPDPTEGPEEDGLRGGLNFPGGEEPDYWDFFHFAVIIGVASQTADIEFTSRTQRRIGTLHGLVSFVFNTVVLALTINLLAGLF